MYAGTNHNYMYMLKIFVFYYAHGTDHEYVTQCIKAISLILHKGLLTNTSTVGL